MSFSIGIVGLPNVGKSTLFKALTKQPVNISNYPFCTIDPNVGIVTVPDQRLKAIAQVIKPEKITPTVIEFVDIAGLVKNAHQGEGLGNQFLARIREVDAICHVVRDFIDEKIAHVEGQPNPERDIEIVNHELAMKNIEAKPTVYVFNVDKKTDSIENGSNIYLNLKREAELSELSKKEIQELELQPSKLNQLIKTCYQALGLITFYTIKGGKETRARTLKSNSSVLQAGKAVHSDFEEKFIRAEVINWQKLIEADTWQKAREKGTLQTEGKEYIVQDGDVIEFKI